MASIVTSELLRNTNALRCDSFVRPFVWCVCECVWCLRKKNPKNVQSTPTPTERLDTQPARNCTQCKQFTVSSINRITISSVDISPYVQFKENESPLNRLCYTCYCNESKRTNVRQNKMFKKNETRNSRSLFASLSIVSLDGKYMTDIVSVVDYIWFHKNCMDIDFNKYLPIYRSFRMAISLAIVLHFVIRSFRKWLTDSVSLSILYPFYHPGHIHPIATFDWNDKPAERQK